MDWQEAIRQWRALPEEEQRRLRLENLPRKVARSFAFEGEPVDLAMLEAELARRLTPRAPAMSAPDQRVRTCDSRPQRTASSPSLPQNEVGCSPTVRSGAWVRDGRVDQ